MSYYYDGVRCDTLAEQVAVIQQHTARLHRVITMKLAAGRLRRTRVA